MEPRVRPRRPSSMRTFRRDLTIRACAVVALSAVLSSGCGLPSDEADEAGATWDLTKDQTPDSDTTAFTVEVTRLGCNSGQTGTVNDPGIEMTDTQVVITFTVSPGEQWRGFRLWRSGGQPRGPGSADCQGNNAVSYDVELPEALSERELVDGGCASTEATGTAPCQPSGVRYTP